MRIVLFIVVLLLVAGLSGTTAHTEGAEIVVTGSGSALVVPDQAKIELSVTSVARVAEEAGEETARKVGSVLAALREVGVDDHQLSTTQFAVQPEWNNKKGRSTGKYVASHRIRVSTTDLNNVGSIVDAALAGGATRVGRIYFTASNVDSARHAALAEAVQHARVDAEVIATAAGGSLGPLIELTTQGSARPPRIESVALKTGVIREVTSITPPHEYINVTILGRWQYRE